MKVNGYHIEMTRGDNETLTVSCAEKPFAAGDKVTLTVRPWDGGGDIQLQKTVTSFDDGQAVFFLEPSDTSGLSFGTYSYDVEVTFSDIGVKTIIPPSKFTLGKENTYE